MNWLSELRMKRGLTQEKLARELDVTTTSVSRWECSDRGPAYRNLCKIARYFDVPVEQVLSHYPKTQASASPLARLRCERGLSRPALAKMVGVDPLTIHYWEAGSYRPKHDKVSKLADCLGVSAKEIYALLDRERS